ncbi:MAG: InlB B-repeat-containing protein [Treponema sp.]|nr:InlB B-repeat-containing protein [Treponema sp.]
MKPVCRVCAVLTAAILVLCAVGCMDLYDDEEVSTVLPFTVTYSDGAEDEEISVPAAGIYETGATVTVSFEHGERNGYTFLGWLDNSGKTYSENGTTSFSMPAENVMLIAKWQENAIQGGGIEMEVSTVTDPSRLFAGTPSSAGSIVTFTCRSGYTYSWLCEGVPVTVTSGAVDPVLETQTFTWDISSASCGENCITLIAKDDESGTVYSATIYIAISK